MVDLQPDGICTVLFPKGSFSGIPLDTVISVEDELLEEARQQLKANVTKLLSTSEYDTARKLYDGQCAEWWSFNEYQLAESNARLEQAQRLIEQEAREVRDVRKRLQKQVGDQLDHANYEEADRLYEHHCTEWWHLSDYEADKIRAQFMHRFVATYRYGSLADLDQLYNNRPNVVDLSVHDFISLKLPKLRNQLFAIGMQLDDEQEQANARPEYRLLIKARAGSGKTRTLCARAALAIRDEQLKPNQVMILAFNKAAAAEVKNRLQKMCAMPGFDNARTFHSLAYQLVKPKKKLLFDAGGHPSAREQSCFVQKTMQRILNSAFKEAMVEFFRKELEQVETIGRDLPPQEYLQFRRALELVTLRGERVKSNGEKFIADFLFEHGIEYQYERVWDWKSDFLGGAVYKPDFTIVVNGQIYLLEHWAIDPQDLDATLPTHWDIDAKEYRQQILAKREFWLKKDKPLLETHAGFVCDGRTAFESRLKSILESKGIRCQKLLKEEIVCRVFKNDFTISRMAELFLKFIQSAKKRGWSADEVARRISEMPDKEPRAQLFHQLALRVYREYEVRLEEKHAVDFDDLLVQATEEVKVRGASASIHLGQGQMMPLGHLKWILLDEYQDFSELYFRMLDAIVKANPEIRLVAVGDDWQAINAFVGAQLRFFEQFPEYFPSAETVSVTTNYRSDQAVVAAGNRLMEGCGNQARISRDTLGGIETRYLGDVWIEFRQGDQFKQDRDSDALYLPPRPVKRHPSEADLRQAKALKLCAEIILKDPTQKTLLLARTRKVYGLDSTAFRTQLIEILSIRLKTKPKSLEANIDVMTAHGSKGQEAHRVIILDATRRQFPKIHPDNLLFELFGITPHSVLEEERRLFYVAITRAEHVLYVLTENGEESPYLDVLNNAYTLHGNQNESRITKDPSLNILAARIHAQIETIGGRREVNPEMQS